MLYVNAQKGVMVSVNAQTLVNWLFHAVCFMDAFSKIELVYLAMNYVEALENRLFSVII